MERVELGSKSRSAEPNKLASFGPNKLWLPRARMRSLSLSVVLLCLVSSVLSSTDVRIYHRISRGHGAEPKPDFTLRGTVTLEDDSTSATYTSTPDSKLDLGAEGFHDCCLYEVAIEKPGAQKDWTFTSTKAVSCLPLSVPSQ